jgi:hypothetical protein
MSLFLFAQADDLVGPGTGPWALIGLVAWGALFVLWLSSYLFVKNKRLTKIVNWTVLLFGTAMAVAFLGRIGYLYRELADVPFGLSRKDPVGTFLLKQLSGLDRQALMVSLGVLFLDLVGFAIRVLVRLGRRGRRVLLLGLTTASGSLTAIFYYLLQRVPDMERSFDLVRELLKLGVALSVTFFVFFSMCVALPWVMDRIEGRGFVSFVATRHVRADKSGCLTVISVLSIGGVFLSSWLPWPGSGYGDGGQPRPAVRRPSSSSSGGSTPAAGGWVAAGPTR